MVTRLLKNGKSRAPTKEKVLRSVLSPCDGVHGVLKNKFGYAGVAPLSWKCYAALAPFIYHWTCSKVYVCRGTALFKTRLYTPR